MLRSAVLRVTVLHELQLLRGSSPAVAWHRGQCTAPRHSVRINLEVQQAHNLVVYPSVLVFTELDWMVPQLVRLAALDDFASAKVRRLCECCPPMVPC